MSGWLADIDGYAMLTAVHFGKEIEKAEQCFDAAMRVADGYSAGFALRQARQHLNKAAQAIRTIEYSVDRAHSVRTKSPLPSPPDGKAL